MSKLFTVVGTSTGNGISKVRFANDLPSRLKTLQSVGHTDIVLYTLPQGMTKVDALAWLQANPGDADQNAIGNKAAAIETVSKRSAVKTPKAVTPVKTKSVKTATVVAKAKAPRKPKEVEVASADAEAAL